MSRNTVLLPPLLKDIALTNRESTAEALLKIFSERINEKEAENATEDSEAE